MNLHQHNEIRLLRKNLILSQEELARAAGVSQMSVSRAERGRHLDAKAARKVIAALLELERR